MKISRECLQLSIDGESTAAEMYLDFAVQAEKDGYPNIAHLFRCLSQAEKVHIKNHRSALAENGYKAKTEEYTVSDTEQNLKSGIEGETYEYKKMYPGFFRKIKKEKNTEYGRVAFLSMQWSSKVEQNHAKLLKKAYKLLKSGSDLPDKNIYVCRVCGNIELGPQTKSCAVCGHDATFFEPLKPEIN